MITKKQAEVLRGFVARHAWCQKEMGKLNAKSAESTRKRVCQEANKATQAVYGFIAELEGNVSTEVQ